jgi:hypothetical protein
MMIVSKQNLRALTKEMFLNLMNEKGLAALEIIRNFNKKEREKMTETNIPQIEKYKIIKFRKSGTQTVLLKNLSLDEAKRYCSRPDTKGKNWFAGFTKQ